MTLTFAAADPDIRDRYREQTRAAMRSQNPRTLVAAAMDRVQDVENGWRHTSVSARNVFLRDALSLLALAQQEEAVPDANAWDFVDVDTLQQQLARLRAGRQHEGSEGSNASALSRLDQLVERAGQDTYASFDAFRQAEAGFLARSPGEVPADDAALQRYDAWLKRFRPYLVLGVPLSLADEDRVDEAEAMIRERVAFFLSKNPDRALDGRHEDRLWTYVYDVRQRLRDAAPA